MHFVESDSKKKIGVTNFDKPIFNIVIIFLKLFSSRRRRVSYLKNKRPFFSTRVVDLDSRFLVLVHYHFVFVFAKDDFGREEGFLIHMQIRRKLKVP